jgi:hypothetical protein
MRRPVPPAGAPPERVMVPRTSPYLTTRHVGVGWGGGGLRNIRPGLAQDCGGKMVRGRSTWRPCMRLTAAPRRSVSKDAMRSRWRCSCCATSRSSCSTASLVASVRCSARDAACSISTTCKRSRTCGDAGSARRGFSPTWGGGHVPGEPRSSRCSRLSQGPLCESAGPEAAPAPALTYALAVPPNLTGAQRHLRVLLQRPVPLIGVAYQRCEGGHLHRE